MTLISRRSAPYSWPLLIAVSRPFLPERRDLAQSRRRYQSRTSNAAMSRITLPSGTVIPMRLDDELSSKNNEQGDKFSATIKSGRDDGGIPAGTRVEGVVREAQASGNGKPGVLDVDFRRMVFPNGGSQTVTASLTSLNGKDVKRQDGRMRRDRRQGKRPAEVGQNRRRRRCTCLGVDQGQRAAGRGTRRGRGLPL